MCIYLLYKFPSRVSWATNLLANANLARLAESRLQGAAQTKRLQFMLAMDKNKHRLLILSVLFTFGREFFEFVIFLQQAQVHSLFLVCHVSCDAAQWKPQTACKPLMTFKRVKTAPQTAQESAAAITFYSKSKDRM